MCREQAWEMFDHGFSNYMIHAFPKVGAGQVLTGTDFTVASPSRLHQASADSVVFCSSSRHLGVLHFLGCMSMQYKTHCSCGGVCLPHPPICGLYFMSDVMHQPISIHDRLLRQLFWGWLSASPPSTACLSQASTYQQSCASLLRRILDHMLSHMLFCLSGQSAANQLQGTGLAGRHGAHAHRLFGYPSGEFQSVGCALTPRWPCLPHGTATCMTCPVKLLHLDCASQSLSNLSLKMC